LTDDPYEVLGVSRSASADDIRRAHRRWVRRLHPDVTAAARGTVDPDAGEMFLTVQLAYELLRDPIKRAAIDRALEAIDREGSARPPVREPHEAAAEVGGHRVPRSGETGSRTGEPGQASAPRHPSARSSPADAPREADAVEWLAAELDRLGRPAPPSPTDRRHTPVALMRACAAALRRSRRARMGTFAVTAAIGAGTSLWAYGWFVTTQACAAVLLLLVFALLPFLASSRN
jgi:curved DNA-binding protein CbpA